MRRIEELVFNRKIMAVINSIAIAIGLTMIGMLAWAIYTKVVN